MTRGGTSKGFSMVGELGVGVVHTALGFNGFFEGNLGNIAKLSKCEARVRAFGEWLWMWLNMMLVGGQGIGSLLQLGSMNPAL